MDAQGWMAVLSSRDQDHAKASGAYDELVRNGWRVYTTNWTLYDAYSHMKEREKGGGVAAAEALYALQKANDFTVVPVTKSLEERATVHFWNFKDRLWSITTWANVLVMRDLNINYVLSGNHHYDQAGLTRLYT